jgi:hypothetical protein
MRRIGHQLWNKIPGWALRTTVGVRSNRYFAGAAAYFAGATDDIYCTICPDKTMEGGWAHTLSCCLNPIIKGMRINRHNELVRVLRDAILHSKKGNAKVYADLVQISWRPETTYSSLKSRMKNETSKPMTLGRSRLYRTLPQPKLSLWRLLKTLKLRVRCSLTVRLGLSALGRRAYH